MARYLFDNCRTQCGRPGATFLREVELRQEDQVSSLDLLTAELNRQIQARPQDGMARFTDP